MQKRIDDASYEWHMTGCTTARKEYYQLIFEVCEIKEAILKDEEECQEQSQP